MVFVIQKRHLGTSGLSTTKRSIVWKYVWRAGDEHQSRPECAPAVRLSVNEVRIRHIMVHAGLRSIVAEELGLVRRPNDVLRP